MNPFNNLPIKNFFTPFINSNSHDQRHTYAFYLKKTESRIQLYFSIDNYHVGVYFFLHLSPKCYPFHAFPRFL